MAETKKSLADLRKPFPKESVGLLPKPYSKDSPKGNCKECGKYHGLPAVHLDYVGHAAVTDRLLEVDPEWTWEPLATDEDGLPKTDRAGNLWIKLTVLGVTRLGVGDGNNAKECIGDALRNAAMRFGVALDLWSKEELESVHDGSVEGNDKPSSQSPKDTDAPAAPKPAPQRAPEPEQAPVNGSGATPKQLKYMATLFTEQGIDEREARHQMIQEIVGRDIESATDLTKAEAKKVIDQLLPEGGEQ